MYVNIERFKTKKELEYFIDKTRIHKDDILYALCISEDLYLLIWY